MDLRPSEISWRRIRSFVRSQLSRTISLLPDLTCRLLVLLYLFLSDSDMACR